MESMTGMEFSFFIILLENNGLHFLVIQILLISIFKNLN
jgi:hypothetical protein